LGIQPEDLNPGLELSPTLKKRFSTYLRVALEEVAKFRAARRMWYRLTKERYHAQNPRSQILRFHVQTSGSTHTYQQPFNNIVRIAHQVLAAALGGAQSIHANSSRNRKLKGVSTYVLHPASDFEASSVAARENAVSTKALSELQDLLPKILKPENFRESKKLARCVQESLVKSLKDAYPKVRDIGVKEGPFFVLMNSGKPAVLVEVSFLSNPEEEKRLSDEDYLESISEGILKGIEAYLKEIKVAAS
jgi:N-acetylmuramoyl-L-alanine amidase